MSGAPIPPRPIRILVFGAGVIGSLYAAKLAAAGNQVTLFARGRRLAELQDAGLRWLVAGAEQVADVEITGELGGGPFDMILVAVRYEQADEALQAVAAAQFSPDVPMVGTMINAPAPYEQWSSILGPVRLVAAFPGAGGSIEHGLLDADFTAESVQITTIGEPAGGLSRRVQRLATVFRGAGIATEISTEMRAWQLCHLALVVPLGDAVFRADAAGVAPAKSWPILLQTARELRAGFKSLQALGVPPTPAKTRIFSSAPPITIAVVLHFIFASAFGERYILRHSRNARTEMAALSVSFCEFVGGRPEAPNAG